MRYPTTTCAVKRHKTWPSLTIFRALIPALVATPVKMKVQKCLQVGRNTMFPGASNMAQHTGTRNPATDLNATVVLTL